MADLRRPVAILLFLLTCAATACFAQDPQFYAVVIGVSQFANLPKEEWLEFAHADAEAFAKFISSPRGRGFPADNVKLFTNDSASLTNVKRWMGSTLVKKIKPDDTVYIFVATHGMVEKEGARAGYLLAHDSDREDLYSSALAMKDLADIMQNRLKAKRIFLFADACRAGKLGQGQGTVASSLESSSRRGEMLGLLASRPNEFSAESKQFGGGHGVFTYYALKGLMGAADGDKDKIVTTTELISYLQVEVTSATNKRQNIRDFGDMEPNTPMAFVDKDAPADLKLAAMPRPQDLKLAAMPRPVGSEVASLFPIIPLFPIQAPGQDLRSDFTRALRENRLVAPPGNNAWEIYQRFTQQAVPQEQKDALQEDLIGALGTAGDKVLAAYRRGDQHVRLDAASYDEGAQFFSRASQLDPDETAFKAKARFMAGRALVEQRRYPEAISALQEAIQLDPQAAYTYNALGLAYMQQGQWNAAIPHFQQASQRAQKWIYPRFNLGFVYFNLQRYPQAEQEIRAGIALAVELGLKYPYLHNNLGVVYFQQRKYREAEEQFRRAIELKPDDANSFFNLGLLYRQRDNMREAEASFVKAASLDARLVGPRMALAQIYRDQGKRGLEERVLREAVAGDPRDAIALEALGRLLLEAKKLDDAEQTFMQMMQVNPASAVPLSWLGDVHAEQRNFAQAAEDYRMALSRAAPVGDERFKRDLQKKLANVEKKK